MNEENLAQSVLEKVSVPLSLNSTLERIEFNI